MDPVKLGILDYDKIIQQKGYREVTSNFVHETSSTKFHPQGLYSEEIFGQIASPERLVRNGYIDLHTYIFHPRIYKIIKALKGLYEEIISGKSYAGFNAKIGDFEKASLNDMELDPKDTPWVEVGTGFTFFLKYWPKVNLKGTGSIARNDKLLILQKYRNRLMCSKWIVVAAGLRDYEVDARGVGSSEDINKLYNSLLNLARAIPAKGGDSPIFDTIRYAIQKKVNDIHAYIVDFLDGKSGFVQRKYGYRKLAFGTRNVITSPNMAAESSHSPQFHDLFETKVPLFQAAKAFQPLVIYHLKSLFFSTVLDPTSENVGVIDFKTHELVYRTIDNTEKNRFLLSESIVDIINLYRNNKIRFRPVRILMADGQYYGIWLMYDTGKEIRYFRDEASLKAQLEAQNQTFDPKYVRDMTYADMLYIATFFATLNRSCTITRYPAIEPGSIYPSKVHLVSTKPGRVVQLTDTMGVNFYTLPEYPMIGNRCVDSTILHPARLAGLDADFDGDCAASGSKIEIRFTHEFKNQFPELEKYITDSDSEWNYADLNIEDFVKPGKPEIKNKIKYYSIPKGCEIQSYNPNDPWDNYGFQPIEKFSDEGIRPVVRCYISNGRYIDVTTNESVAVFDFETGGIKRVSPFNTKNCLVPVYKNKRVKPCHKIPKFDSKRHGWFLGSMLSDGWVSEDYLGYTKMDDQTRFAVESFIFDSIGQTPYHKISHDVSDKKLGPSHSLIYHNKDAFNFGNSMDMYATEEKSALTKRISPEVFKDCSHEFLYGLLSGLIDGDGSLSCIQKVNGPSFDVRISTSSKYLVEDLKRVCYILGLRFYITKSNPRNWSSESYTFGISAVDVYWNLNSFEFVNQNNIAVSNYWKSMACGRDNRDIIPVSNCEAEFLKRESLKRNDQGLYSTMTPSGSHRVTREKLLEYADVIPPESALYSRMWDRRTIWCPITGVEEIGDVQTWDFEIPTTKTFTINEGILIYDTISVNGIMSEEANKEVDAYYNSLGSLVDLSGGLLVNLDTDLVKWITFNLTRDPSIA